jgi:hypothetical protein
MEPEETTGAGAVFRAVDCARIETGVAKKSSIEKVPDRRAHFKSTNCIASHILAVVIVGETLPRRVIHLRLKGSHP